jgi:hypothetical protein
MPAASSALRCLMMPLARSRSHNFALFFSAYTRRGISTNFNKSNNTKMQKEQRRRPMMPITTACTACAQYGSGDAPDVSQAGQGDRIVKDWKCSITTSGNQEECQAFPLEVSVDTLNTKYSIHTEVCLTQLASRCRAIRRSARPSLSRSVSTL